MQDKLENDLPILFKTSYCPISYFQDKGHPKIQLIYKTEKWIMSFC